MATWLEYIVLISIFVAYPIYDRFMTPRIEAAIRSGDPRARLRLYRDTIVFEHSATLAVLGLAMASQVSWANLGLGFELHRGMWIAWGLVVLGFVQMAFERHLLKTQPAWREKARAKMTKIAILIPTNRTEWRRYIGVAFTAGVCEEILFRGFLFWWLQQHMDVLPAAVASTVVFGLAHAYQGWTGILQTGLLGGVLMLIAWLAGSLWPAIVLHIAIDLFSGYLCYTLLRDSDETDAPLEKNDPPVEPVSFNRLAGID